MGVVVNSSSGKKSLLVKVLSFFLLLPFSCEIILTHTFNIVKCNIAQSHYRWVGMINQTETMILTLKFGCEIQQGAVENVLERSTKMQLLDGSVIQLDQSTRNLISQVLHEMSSSALRCLGFAYKDELTEFETYDGDEDHPAYKLLLDPSNYSSIESNLTFVGLVGLRVSPVVSHAEISIFHLIIRNFVS